MAHINPNRGETPIMIKTIGLLDAQGWLDARAIHEALGRDPCAAGAGRARAAPLRAEPHPGRAHARRHPETKVEIDGVAELWFDDQAALEAAARTPEMKALHADGAKFIGRIKSYVVEEKFVIGS